MAVVAIGMWMGALSAGFGAVYILLLGFVIVFANLGTRREGEQSAYPVFNNFQPLQGEHRMDQVEARPGRVCVPVCVCVECLIGKQRNQFFLRSPSRVPYRTELIPRVTVSEEFHQ